MGNFDYKCRMIEEELQSFWPGWHVVNRLGGGAFGDVFQIYKDNNMGIRTESALKVIQVVDNNTNSTTPPESVLTEIRIMEILRGAPNIVSIEDCYYRKDPGGSNLARLFIRMELLRSFEDILQHSEETMKLGWEPHQAFLSVEEVCRLGIDICTALDYCEKYQIIHRDIKPANLFIDRFGNYKVGDFGVSRQVDSLEAAYTMTGIGTISYMAPEIYMRMAYNHTVDIYALGLVLYQLLNYGRAPFMPSYPTALTTADVDAANYQRLKGAKIQKIPHIDKRLNKIILKACAYRSDARYQTAQEFRNELEDYLQIETGNSGMNAGVAGGRDPAGRGTVVNAGESGGGRSGQNASYGTGQGYGTGYAAGQGYGTGYVSSGGAGDILAPNQAAGAVSNRSDGIDYGTMNEPRNGSFADNKTSKFYRTCVIVALIVTLAGVAGVCGFHVAESNTKKASYDSYIRSAEMSTELADKKSYYMKAIDRQPAREEAYNSFLTYLEEDQVIDDEEKKALEECLNNHSETSGNSTNIDYLRSKNREAYDKFEFRLGKDYFSYLTIGGKADANRCLKEIKYSTNLSEQDSKIAHSLLNLTYYYVEQGIGEYNYADFWKMLQEITYDPTTIDDKTGDVPYSVAMYREVASQIAENIREFRNAGVTEQQMRDIMTAAELYLSGLDRNQYSNLYEILIPQTQNAIEDANSIIAAAFNAQ